MAARCSRVLIVLALASCPRLPADVRCAADVDCPGGTVCDAGACVVGADGEGEGEGDVVGEGEGDVVGEGEGDVVGEGEGDVVGEGEGPPPPPPRSCKDEHQRRPATPSGTILVDEDGDGVVDGADFCDMERNGGGWTRVTTYTYAPGTCPAGLVDPAGAGCGHANVVDREVGDSASTFFALPVAAFTEIMGSLRAVADGGNAAWDQGRFQGQTTVDGVYLDGFSLTLNTANVRRHVWSWAAGQGDTNIFHTNHCPCRGSIPPTQFDDQGGTPTPPPAFVGADFFCEEPRDLLADGVIDDVDVLFDGQQLNAACAGSPQSGVVFTRVLGGDVAGGFHFELRDQNASGSADDHANTLLTFFELFVR